MIDGNWIVRRDEIMGWIDGLSHLPERTQVFYCIDGTIASGEALLAASLNVLRVSHQAAQKRSMEALLIFSIDPRHGSALQNASTLESLAKYLLDYGTFGRPDIMIREPNGPFFSLTDDAIVFHTELSVSDPNLRSVLRLYRHWSLEGIESLEPVVFTHQADVTL